MIYSLITLYITGIYTVQTESVLLYIDKTLSLLLHIFLCSLNIATMFIHLFLKDLNHHLRTHQIQLLCLKKFHLYVGFDEECYLLQGVNKNTVMKQSVPELDCEHEDANTIVWHLSHIN